VKTKNLSVIALGAVLVVALWWNFLLKPAQSQAKKVKAETQTEQAKIPPLEAQLAQANADAAHAGALKAQLAQAKRAVPELPALSAWIRDANSIAAASHLSWLSVTHAAPTASATGVSSILLGVQVRGTYEQVLDYLTRLASMDRLVVVDGVTFSATTASTPGSASTGNPAQETTGPFSGGSQLTGTITARMFEALPPSADASTGAAGSTPTTGPAAA
jgi:Tfp pilus assembly protein PilO